ncbi:MAG TPA: choice-of-anchor Q domain-containing protein [Solirubrobacteraceae bacterium]|nr:choice-of-anchor Q domain-containing protein [Solirubrobacteraceae bacterium]
MLEGVAPNGSAARVTIDGLHAPSSPATVALVLVQASQVTVRWLRFTGVPGNPTGQAPAVFVQTGGGAKPPPGSLPGPRTITNVQIVDNVFDNVWGTSLAPGGARPNGLFISSGAPNTRYSDITVARNTFRGYANIDGDGLGVLATTSGTSISTIVIRDNTFYQDNGSIELNDANIAPHLRGIQIIGNTITGAGLAKGIGIALLSAATNATTDDTVIEDNMISGFDNGNAIQIAAQVPLATGVSGFTPSGDVISNTQIVNNVIRHDSPSTAIVIAGGNSSPPSGVSGVTIENDTLVNTAPGGPAWLLSEGSGSAGNYITGVVIRNTILWSPNGTPIPTGMVGPGIYAQRPEVVTNSLISGPGWAGSNGNINTDPMFVNEAGSDYHLAAGSAAINAGTTVGAAPFDRDGARRDAQPDIGAYEYGAAPRPLLTVTAYPLGGNGTITSSPAGISCGTRCTAQLDANTKITLSAKPDSRSRFVGWRGACSGTRGCTITLAASKSVTARFGPR